MRFVKYFAVWIASLLIIVIAVNFGFGLFVNHFALNVYMSALSGYTTKWNFPLPEPTTEEEEKANGAPVMMRTLFSNQRLYAGAESDRKFPYFKMIGDQSTIILNRDGWHPFSAGYFATVYHDFGEFSDYVRHTVGLADIGELSKKEGAAALCDALAATPDAVIRLDAYTLEQGKVTPVQITVLDQSGKEIQVFDFPAEGEVIRENNCIMKNISQDYNNQYDTNGLYNICEQLKMAFAGERSADRIAQKYAEKVTPGAPDYEENHLKFGAACITRIYIEAIDGNTSIYAVQFRYLMALLIYSAALGLIMTVVLTVLFIKRRW